MLPRGAVGTDRLKIASFLIFASGTAVWADDASQTVEGYVNGRCQQELVSFKEKAIADKDIWQRFDALSQNSPLRDPSRTSVAVWSATAYAVIDNGVFASDAPKMSTEKRARIADSLDASVTLMGCLDPSDAEWTAVTTGQGTGNDIMTELRQSGCVLPWAEKTVELLRGDLNGEALKSALALAKTEMYTNCARKG